MDPTDTGIFRLAEARMRYLDQRQSVLAQNVSNASTPGFHARDLPSFAASLQTQSSALAQTDPAHLTSAKDALHGVETPTNGRAPNGNTVAMEEQLGKIADTSGQQEVVTSLFHKYQSLFHLVLGRSA